MYNFFFKSLNQKNLIILCSLSIFLVSTYLIFLNFYNESGYWYDEWCTLLSSDPNVGLKIIKERHAGNFEKPYENVPIIYYLVLRFFFTIFGYTAENGRIFSLIFLILSTITFFNLLKFFTSKSKSLFAASIFFSTPLIIWMSNETRVDIFVVFFVLLNILIFFLVLRTNRLEAKFFLLIINFITLSIFPLTLSIIGSQLLFLIIQKFLNKGKINSAIIFILLSLIFYFIFNYEYFLERSLNRDDHFATLKLNFFILYYFNIFFGSVFFGAILFLLFIYFLISQNKKILKDQLLLFTTISIILTYMMVFISSIFVTPIAAPRYIIFIIPIILIFIFISVINHKNQGYFLIFLFFFALSNIIINYDERHIKKPNYVQSLDLIEKNIVKDILILPSLSKTSGILYHNYISTVTKSKKFNLFTNFDEIKNNKIEKFVLLCLYNPRFAGNVNKDFYNYCNENYIRFKNIKQIVFLDYKIKFFQKY